MFSSSLSIKVTESGFITLNISIRHSSIRFWTDRILLIFFIIFCLLFCFSLSFSFQINGLLDESVIR
jgi:hypothetical protein